MTGEADSRALVFSALVEVAADVSRTVEALHQYMQRSWTADKTTTESLNHVLARMREAMHLAAIASLQWDDLRRLAPKVEADG